ncbi:MAG: hypothetical protein RKR03_11055 [Candidatus Competibacter sp.]|nr:hypothetical protein [Candidatus Competibacter sp.]
MNARYATTSLALVLAGYAAGAGAVEPSALLRQPQGRVFVGQTTAMQPARPEMPLYAGDRVVAVSGGRAEVVYPDGCAVAVPEGSLLAVKGPEQCRTGQARIRAVEGFQNPRIGQAGPLPGQGGTSGDGPKAVLKQLRGNVAVGQTRGTMPAEPDMTVFADNRIIVKGADSRVTLVFDDRCSVTLEGEQNVLIEELVKNLFEAKCTGIFATRTPLVVIGGVIVAGAIAASNNDDNQPASRAAP